MRALVIVLGLLAALKIWTQDQMYRTATTDALIHAYRARAIDACQKGNGEVQPASREAAQWAEPASVKLVVGRADVDVHLWDVGNPLWDMRFKHPYLVLSANGPRNDLVCSYDVIAGLATVSGM